MIEWLKLEMKIRLENSKLIKFIMNTFRFGKQRN